MISDYLKGKTQFDYSPAVQKGIRLHREIDRFTDTHPVTQELKSFFRPQYRLYAGAFADIVYDHFLANDRGIFSNEKALDDFAIDTYRQLEKMSPGFPPAFQQMFPYMKEYNWLANYRHRRAIERSFIGLSKRARYLKDTVIAFELFNLHYDQMQLCYNRFFPELKAFTLRRLTAL